MKPLMSMERVLEPFTVPEGGRENCVMVRGRTLYAILTEYKSQLGPKPFLELKDAVKKGTGVDVELDGLKTRLIPLWLQNWAIGQFLGVDVVSPGPEALAKVREFGRSVAKEEIGSMVVFFAKALPLPTVIKQIVGHWKYEHSSGEAVIEHLDTTERTVKVRIIGFEEPSRFYCAVVNGFLEGTGQMLIDRVIKFEETACVLDGAPFCEFTATW